jgi:transposase-like protein
MVARHYDVNANQVFSWRKRFCDAPRAPAVLSARLSGALRAEGMTRVPPASAWLMKQGYEVFRNVSPVGEADLVIFYPETKELKRVDVKTPNLYVTKSGEVRSYSISEAKRNPDVSVLLVHPVTGDIYWH